MNSFVDSNICIYALNNSDAIKQNIAFDILDTNPIITSQVCIETMLVLSRKFKLPLPVCEDSIKQLLATTHFMPITLTNIEFALSIKSKYKFSFLDSIIVVSALHNNCEILYSEDMHHGLIVENKLTIINPFL
jgi:predicted nucleic acid-binding protein